MKTQIKKFIVENPAILLTVCYFIITAIGVFYSYFFYRQFDINIIKLADLSDFLMASILEPRSIIVFLSLIVLIGIAYWFDVLLRKKFKRYGDFIERRLKASYSDPIGYICILIFYTYWLVNYLAVENADKIKAGVTDNFLIRISDHGSQTAEQNLALLGGTSRYTFFYDDKNSSAVVIPVENVSFMQKAITKNNLDAQK